ncbi:MAG: phosphate acyltransferase PlsX [Candidatus Omnitrophica bacterium]|nr:phosphate acyltransferase PlsX [Candidatus Omnitrophota bacterium]
MRIVVDAMGGDHAPDAPVRGAVLAAEECGYDIILVGRQDEINKVIAETGYKGDKLKVVDASEVITMEEPAAVSVRKKRDSSIVKAFEIVKKGEADAFVSAGNTGAVVCAATLTLRLLEGIDRPGIAVLFPALSRSCLVLDVGANIDPKPLHLLQYGIMGDAYSRHVLGKKDPIIAMLNIGEESTKGTDFQKEAHMLLSKSKLNFIGNLEPKEVYKGTADVVVCDGYVGNVFLKVTEGFAYAAAELIKRELKKSNFITKIGALLTKPAFMKIKKRVDASEYGGAPLMGIDGRVIISHGASNAIAMKNAIRAAASVTDHHVNAHILEELSGKI